MPSQIVADAKAEIRPSEGTPRPFEGFKSPLATNEGDYLTPSFIPGISVGTAKKGAQFSANVVSGLAGAVGGVGEFVTSGAGFFPNPVSQSIGKGKEIFQQGVEDLSGADPITAGIGKMTGEIAVASTMKFAAPSAAKVATLGKFSLGALNAGKALGVVGRTAEEAKLAADAYKVSKAAG